MRRLAIMLALPAALLAVGAATAALPSPGPFTGTTSLHSMNGFHDLVTFTSSKGGRTLKSFQVGTLGCLGATGAFPVGVDPYAQAYTDGTINAVPVSSSGVILTTTKLFAETDGITTEVTIKASFTSAKELSGTIAVTQSENGSKCGPTTMKFSAVPGTPSASGCSGRSASGKRPSRQRRPPDGATGATGLGALAVVILGLAGCGGHTATVADCLTPTGFSSSSRGASSADLSGRRELRTHPLSEPEQGDRRLRSRAAARADPGRFGDRRCRQSARSDRRPSGANGIFEPHRHQELLVHP